MGHSKRMAVVRKEWIDEGKPGYVARQRRREEVNDDEDGVAMAAGALPKEKEAGDGADEGGLFFPEANENKVDEEEAGPDEDELDALLAEQSARPAPKPTQTDPESEGEDDLDTLLAGEATRERVQRQQNHSDEDEDDLDALLAERDASKTKEPDLPPPRNTTEDEDEADDLEAALAELGSRKQADAAAERSSSPFVAIDDGPVREHGEEGKSSSPFPSFEEEAGE